MLDKLESKDFAPYLHQTFQLYFEGVNQAGQYVRSESIEVELIEVTELGHGPEDEASTDRRRPFSVVFRESAGLHLPQSIYSLEHPAMGKLTLFLVPIGTTQEGIQYQAVFN